MKRKVRKRTAVLARTGKRGEGVYALRQLAKFLNDNGWRPSPGELADATCYRSRWWWWRRLRSSARLGTVRQHRRGQWELTRFGWENLGLQLLHPLASQKPRNRNRRVIAARATLLRRRIAAATIYDRPPCGLVVPGLERNSTLPIIEG